VSASSPILGFFAGLLSRHTSPIHARYSTLCASKATVTTMLDLRWPASACCIEFFEADAAGNQKASPNMARKEVSETAFELLFIEISRYCRATRPKQEALQCVERIGFGAGQRQLNR